MTFDMLQTGQRVQLDVWVGRVSSSIPTVVIGKTKGAILLEPYSYKGSVVDFSNAGFDDITIDLNCMDTETGSRIGWKNVNVKLIEHMGRQYYGVRVKSFESYAKSSERRGNNRMIIKASGVVAINGVSANMEAVDISESGFSFYTSERIAGPGNQVTVNFADTVSEREFNLKLKLRIVRVEERDGRFFNAGTLAGTDNNFLAYICFKRLSIKKMKKMS